MATAAVAIGGTGPDWGELARKAARRRSATTAFLFAFLVIGSLPILIPYLWLLVIAFTGSTAKGTAALWQLVAVIGGITFVWVAARLTVATPSRRRQIDLLASILLATVVLVLVGRHFNLQNWRFLWNPDVADALKGDSGAGAKFPSVWTAFGNSLILASLQVLVVVGFGTLAGYYLSRHDFPGRTNYLRSVLVLHAFPAMTLIVPIFLMMYWIGLLDTKLGVVLVIAAPELPFAIFIMKGFFDAVPWDIEMSAMTDGASRRQAFWLVVLPQVRIGMIAVGIFEFLRGWEEYVFVRTLLFSKGNWTMSLYLFWVREDVMGVDYALVSAVGVFYVLPSILLYATTQQYLTMMTFGGTKG